MLRKKIWIPILCVFVIAMGCGLFYGRKVANQEPVKVYKPASVEQPATPKPPPPGESYETGHWHGDEWHSEPHDTPTEAQQPTAEAQDGRGIAEPVNAQTGAPMPGGSETVVPSANLSESSQRTQTPLEAYDAELKLWSDKYSELSHELLKASREATALIPGTEEELKRFEKDPELQRKFNEANAKVAKIDRMLAELYQKMPVRP